MGPAPAWAMLTCHTLRAEDCTTAPPIEPGMSKNDRYRTGLRNMFKNYLDGLSDIR
jgi:hypothetical protein